MRQNFTAARLRLGPPPPIVKGARGERAGVIPAVLALLLDEAVAICALDGLKLKPTTVFNA